MQGAGLRTNLHFGSNEGEPFGKRCTRSVVLPTSRPQQTNVSLVLMFPVIPARKKGLFGSLANRSDSYLEMRSQMHSLKVEMLEDMGGPPR